MALFKNINFEKLKNGLNKTRNKLVNRINETLEGKAVLDENILDEIEEILISSDIGIETSEHIIENARIRMRKSPQRTKESVISAIQDELKEVLYSFDKVNNSIEHYSNYKPYVILIVGVNGAGKTTTVGKLAYNFKKAGLGVVIGSADTFRAAANEQLEIWAKRAGVNLVQKSHGSDPSSVAHDTLNFAIQNKTDIVIIDTAGRLHTKTNLMEELRKIRKVISNVIDYAPNETLLVLDGNTGQNALLQAKEFEKYTDLTGLIITKLDGTAKGGIVFQIVASKKVPVRYIGIGEGLEDLQTFDPEEFVKALFVH